MTGTFAFLDFLDIFLTGICFSGLHNETNEQNDGKFILRTNTRWRGAMAFNHNKDDRLKKYYSIEDKIREGIQP